MTKPWLPILLLAYLGLAVSTLVYWNINQRNQITGDEPHYLVMASGIAKFGSLEQTLPYKDEFHRQAILKGLAPLDAEPSVKNTHAVRGPHGLFNIHNLGLPIVLAVPFLLGGVFGAKLFMVFCGALVVVWAWKFAGLWATAVPERFWVVFATCIAMPFIPAAGQIYPEMPAGLISLVGLYWFFTIDKARPRLAEWTVIGVIAFLPWLQIKFAPACVVLLLAAAAKIHAESKDYWRIGALFIIAGASACLLAAYDLYAFGNLTGPYDAFGVPGMVLSRSGPVVFFGLFLDQNQGFLLQNPLYLAGVFGIGMLWRCNRRFTLLWALVFLSMIVPNALHPALYGATSFSGRFGWAGTVVFMVSTLFALVKLAEASRMALYLAVGAGAALQSYLLFAYTIGKADLHNHMNGTLASKYSIFYGPIWSSLPMLYNEDWSYRFALNYVWLLALAAIFIAGFLSWRTIRLSAPYAVGCVTMAFVGASFADTPWRDYTTFVASDLPSQTGHTQGTARVARAGVDRPGFLDFGPYASLKRGQYQVVVEYSSSAAETQSAGIFDISDATAHQEIAMEPLHGTGGVLKRLSANFKLGDRTAHLMEFRNNWGGTVDLKIYDIQLRPCGRRC